MMAGKWADRARMIVLLLLASAIFFVGLSWGLPSDDADRFLFGSSQAAWSAKEIEQIGGPWTPDATRGADVDQNPLHRRDQASYLNQIPAQQAEIIRRYRLFSHQPDEMVSFMALARMRGGNFDPGMYQYGGLWIYPVGALLKIASSAGLITVTGDLSHYLDYPEDFGHFYIVARAYSAFWGLLGVWVVYRLARRIIRGATLPTAAAIGFLLLPVVVNATHEAKPHLAGAVLILLTVLAAARFLETQRRRDMTLAGIFCGMAAGMVLSGAIAGVVLVAMTLLSHAPWRQRITTFLAAGGIAIAVFALANPFLVINLVRNPQVVRSNLGTLSRSRAIAGRFEFSKSIPNAIALMAEGVSSPLAAMGACGAVAGLALGIASRRRRCSRSFSDASSPAMTSGEPQVEALMGAPDQDVPGESASANPAASRTALLLAAPTALALIQFVALAADKPGEYGRFAILPDIGLLLAAIWSISQFAAGARVQVVVAALLLFLVGARGTSYLAGFIEDSGSIHSRSLAAEFIDHLPPEARTLAMPAEPAPYNLPPVQLDRWRLLLLPEDGSIPREGADVPDVIVRPVDDPRDPDRPTPPGYRRHTIVGRHPWLLTRISWADKAFDVFVRDGLATGQRHPLTRDR